MDSFIIYEWLLLLPVTVNGVKGWASIDTGATASTVSGRIAHDLKVWRDMTVRGAIKEQSREIVKLEEVVFLGEKFENLEASIDKDFLDKLPIETFMTCGVDILYSHPLILDFKELKVGFEEEHSEVAEGLDITKAKGLVTFQMKLGDSKITALLDTGAGFSVINGTHLEDFAFDVTPVYSIEVKDPMGGVGAVDVFTGDLQIGDLDLDNEEFLLMDLSGIEEALDTRIDFILGASTMLRSNAIWKIGEEKLSIAKTPG